MNQSKIGSDIKKFWYPSLMKLWPTKGLDSYVCRLTILSCSAFNSAFVAKLCKSNCFINSELSDVLTNLLFSIFATSVSFVNLL